MTITMVKQVLSGKKYLYLKMTIQIFSVGGAGGILMERGNKQYFNFGPF